jgi:hypothetical protein
MSLFASGSAVLFNNPESAFPINHSVGEEEKEGIKDIPSLEEIMKEESEEPKSEESGESVEEAKERKKDREAEEIRIAANKITKDIQEVEKHLHEARIKIDGDSVVSETLGNLNAMTLDECDEFLTKINELLREINEINKQVNGSKSEVKTKVDSNVKTLNKFEKFLKDTVDIVKNKKAELIRTHTVEEAEKYVKAEVEKLKQAVSGFSIDSLIDQKKGWEQVLIFAENITEYLKELEQSVLDELLGGKVDKSEIDALKDLITKNLADVELKIKEIHDKFNKYVESVKEDEIKGFSSYSDLSKEEKEKVISKIQEAIDGYNNAITGLDAFKGEPVLQDSVANQESI